MKKQSPIKPVHRALSETEKRFVALYEGGDDPVEVLKMAGFEGNEFALKRKAEQLLNSPAIQRALRAKEGYAPHIPDETSLLEMTARIATNVDEKTKDRLQAFKLLMQNKGMLVDRVKYEGDGLEKLLTQIDQERATTEPEPRRDH